MAHNLVKPGLVWSLDQYLGGRKKEYKRLHKSWRDGRSRYPSAPASWPPDRCMLTSLPAELLLMICRPLYQADLFHLALTCRALVGTTVDLLYRRDISEFDCLALRWACTFGIVPTLERTLSYGAPPGHIFSSQSHVGCSWVNTQRTFSVLLGRSVSDTPLCTAIVANEPSIVRRLIEHGVDVNDPGADASEIAYHRRCKVLYPIHLAMGLPDTPFGEAFQPGNTQTVRYLLDAGADPNQSTQIRQFRNMGRILVPGLTPLLMAMQPAVPVETVAMLLERGASPTKTGSYDGWFFPKRRNIRRECWDRSPLGAALLGSANSDSFPLNMDKIQLLLAHGGAHEHSYITAWRIPSYPMPVMCRHWDHPKAVEILRLFITHGANIAGWADRLIPPTLSVIWWAETAIALCLATGVPHKVWAVTEKVCKVITLLAEATLDEKYIGPTRKSAIMDATVAVSSECRRIPHSKKGQSALRYMCRSIDFGGSPQIIRLLLEYGADMNSRDARGLTPLHYASMFSSGDRVRELVQFLGGPAGSGLAVNAADARGWTPLHYACLFGLWDDLDGQAATARLLVESGANVSTRTNNRWTPLSLAALTANQPLIDLLLDYGAHADDLFLPREGGSDENGTEAALVPIGRIIFHSTAGYSWPGPCPGLLKMKTKLAACKAGVVALLGHRLGIEVPLLAVPENPLLPPDLQFEDRFRTPTPRFRVDKMDHPLGITSEAPGDFTSDDFERDIDGVLYLLDCAGLEALVMAPLQPEDMRISWRGAPVGDDPDAP